MDILPHWEQGTPGVLCVAGPHAIPISTAVRGSDSRLVFALGDGLELQLVSDPEWDSSTTFAAGIQTARFLLGA